MNIWLILPVFLLACQINAHAQIIDVAFSGVSDEKYANQDYAWQTKPYTGSATVAGGIIGGPSAGDNWGFSNQFVLSQEIYISNINYDALLTNADSRFSNGVNFQFVINQGNAPIPFGPGNTFPIPNPNSVLYNSNPINLNFDLKNPPVGGSAIYNDTQTDSGLTSNVGLTLKPGTYWLSTEGVPEGSSGYLYESLGGSVVNPEPATILLFGLGLFLLSARSKRSRSYPSFPRQ